MAGYFIYSLDADVFQQLTTVPTVEQSLALADSIFGDLDDSLKAYWKEGPADPLKWPRDRAALAESIRKRLASPDWYADLTIGDQVIWENLLYNLMDECGVEIGIGFQAENDSFYWDAAEIAAQQGASMMAEPNFGGSGFRCSDKSRCDLDGLSYSLYLPTQAVELLKQLEKVAPHFETMPDEEFGDRDQFFNGLLEPVRNIVAAGRVMWVQTDS